MACICADPLDLAATEAEEATASKVRLLLRAGANPNITDKNGPTPMAFLRKYHPNCHTVITLLQQALAEAEKPRSSSRPAALPSPPPSTPWLLLVYKAGWHEVSLCRAWR
jgi:hypothetical protein